MNQGIYIDMVVNSVLQNMLFGGILAILVLFLFLRDIKPTFVIACSIPLRPRAGAAEKRALRRLVFQTRRWTAALDSIALKCIFIKFFLSAKDR